ncbi:hypothetical protein QR685DRAFT_608897 [Neurospora intermedia]|uniref:Uncharacterized protein n=1 Tax=Neurospora intermedia TaxID=5142 RepID=A0ABR3D2N9_NEUIN
MAAANGTVQPVPLLALWCPPPTLVYYATCEGGSLDAGRVAWRSGGGCGWPISSHGCRAWSCLAPSISTCRPPAPGAAVRLVPAWCGLGAVLVQSGAEALQQRGCEADRWDWTRSIARKHGDGTARQSTQPSNKEWGAADFTLQ